MAVANRASALTETASATSLVASMPAGVQVNDIIVGWLTADSTIANLTITSTGWVELSAPDSFNSTINLTACYYHVVTNPGAIPTLSMATAGAAGRQTWITSAYTECDTSSPIDVPALLSTAPTQNFLTETGITIVTNGAMLISCVGAGYSAQGFTGAPSGMTLRQNHTNNVGRASGLADQYFGTAMASGDKTWTRTSATATAWQGILFALKPAVAVTHSNRNYIWLP